MPAKPCSICTHPQRATIDLNLASGTMSMRAAAVAFGVSRGPLARHFKEHLAPAAKAAAARAADQHGDDVFRAAQELNTKTMRILDEALAEGDGWKHRKAKPELALRAIREARANLELIARLQGDLEDGQPVEVVILYDDDWRAGTD